MESYTGKLEDIVKYTLPSDEDFFDKLCAVTKYFRSFDAAMDEFLEDHGFTGDIGSPEDKVDFLKRKFQQASIKAPRNMLQWFTESRTIEKSTAILLTFAFELNLEEANEFLNKYCLVRGFDCHNIHEAICYFAIRNHIAYPEAEKLIERYPKEKMGNIDNEQDILYTKSIQQEIDGCKTLEDLQRYLDDNIEQFKYNNATAYSQIRTLWGEISSPKGLAFEEKQKLLRDEEVILTRNTPGSAGTDPAWAILLQIFGFDKYQMITINSANDRSIKPILENNQLLHPLAAACFPDRQGLLQILNGKHKSEEVVRKLLILLEFYYFWINRALKPKNKSYMAKEGDANSCLKDMNEHLSNVFYPELYIGNPYDWLFMYALQDDFPLETFRRIMNQMYLLKMDEFEIGV